MRSRIGSPAMGATQMRAKTGAPMLGKGLRRYYLALRHSSTKKKMALGIVALLSLSLCYFASSSNKPSGDIRFQFDEKKGTYWEYKSLEITLDGCGHSSINKSKASLVYATSTSSKVFNSMDWDGTVFAKRDYDLPGEFWLFGEDSWDRKHNRSGLDLRKSLNPVCAFDLFVREPWLHTAMANGGSIDRFYEFAGDMEPCDQPLKIKSGKLLVRKIAAMYHSLTMMEDGATLIWLDTDVTIREPVDDLFLAFVRYKDITYIPFMSDPEWADRNASAINFKSLDDPFWRIESGLVAMTANNRSRGFLSEVLDLYRGGLLDLASRCLKIVNENAKLEDLPLSKFELYNDAKMMEEMCHQPWLKRNLYMDDIFAVSMTLHRHHHFNTDLKQGWFWMDCHRDCERCRNSVFKVCPPQCDKCSYEMHPKGVPFYVFPDTVYGSQPYIAPFNTVRYFLHHCGAGAYSKTFREGSRTVKSDALCVMPGLDEELTFGPWERFNSSLEFRFKGESYETLNDRYWSIEARLRRKEAGLWPRHWPLVGQKKWWRSTTK
mmetsp:Transcript_2059/g.3932  ORF Transcript_2059/g.3932 Transcript_2059/m.3932 type:complete len:547 (+) Transcript_2059:44-1684(+)